MAKPCRCGPGDAACVFAPPHSQTSVSFIEVLQGQVTPETTVNSEENNEIILNILMCPRKHAFVPGDFDKNAKKGGNVFRCFASAGLILS